MSRVGHFDMPAIAGTSLAVRAANRLRREAPRLCHWIQAMLRIPVRDRYSSMTWQPVFRHGSHGTVLLATNYEDAVRQLVEAGGQGTMTLAGLSYEVEPTVGIGFTSDGAGITRRKYHDYDEYLRHQHSKLEVERDFVFRTSDKRYQNFLQRIAAITQAAGLRGSVLCLGSRLGEEVRAFRSLGMLAIGIDLNPGSKNAYTLYGDFHDLAFPDSIFDVVYCNSLDHVLDFPRFMAEAVRVARPDSRIYFVISGGYHELGLIDPYGASFWATNDEFVAALRPYVRHLIADYKEDTNFGRHIVFAPNKDATSATNAKQGNEGNAP